MASAVALSTAPAGFARGLARVRLSVLRPMALRHVDAGDCFRDCCSAVTGTTGACSRTERETAETRLDTRTAAPRTADRSRRRTNDMATNRMSSCDINDQHCGEVAQIKSAVETVGEASKVEGRVLGELDRTMGYFSSGVGPTSSKPARSTARAFCSVTSHNAMWVADQSMMKP